MKFNYLTSVYPSNNLHFFSSFSFKAHYHYHFTLYPTQLQLNHR
ncbi:unnamed protein product [Brassica oleracea]|uniref:(rape) hypothetical protein n=1 Tax=Brassica napus TaxID=3708 RepID=A0A816J2K7_BRANA|nr:unnamed protein product [Brassica napus]